MITCPICGVPRDDRLKYCPGCLEIAIMIGAGAK